MSTKQDDQNVKLIPWTSDQRTKWSDVQHMATITQDGPYVVLQFVLYFLWESSTESMASVGMPTDADAKMWVEWLKSRPDADHKDIVSAIQACEEYITPTK